MVSNLLCSPLFTNVNWDCKLFSCFQKVPEKWKMFGTQLCLWLGLSGKSVVMTFKQTKNKTKTLLKLGRDMLVGANDLPSSSSFHWKWKQQVSLFLYLSFLGLYWYAQPRGELKLFAIGLCLQPEKEYMWWSWRKKEGTQSLLNRNIPYQPLTKEP